MGWRIVALSVVAALAAGPAIAVAQGSEAEDAAARAHFEAGTHALDTGEYARASTEFRAAYAATHRPELLYDIYLAEERGGNVAAAVEALEGYLRDGSPEQDRRDSLTARLANLRARLAEQRAADAEAALAAERAGSSTPTPTGTSDQGGGGGVNPAGIGVLIAAGVLLVSFAVFGGLSEAEHSSLATRCATVTCTESDVGALRFYNGIADASWITASIAGVTGLLLLFLLPPDRPATTTPSSARLVPWATPTSGGLVLSGAL